MEVAFENRQLRKIFENEEYAIEEFGLDISKKLQDRLADLIACKSLKELLVGNPRPADNMLYEINVSAEYKIVFTSNHIKNKFHVETGIILWEYVRRIKILAIEKN